MSRPVHGVPTHSERAWQIWGGEAGHDPAHSEWQAELRTLLIGQREETQLHFPMPLQRPGFGLTIPRERASQFGDWLNTSLSRYFSTTILETGVLLLASQHAKLKRSHDVVVSEVRQLAERVLLLECKHSPRSELGAARLAVSDIASQVEGVARDVFGDWFLELSTELESEPDTNTAVVVYSVYVDAAMSRPARRERIHSFYSRLPQHLDEAALESVICTIIPRDKSIPA